MKNFILAFFIFTAGSLISQCNGCSGCSNFFSDSSSVPAKKFYFLWRMGLGYQTIPSNKGDLSIQFPMQVYNTNTGASYTSEFTSVKNNPFSKNSIGLDLIDMEFGTQRVFFPFKLGISLTYLSSFYLQGGVGYNFYIPGYDTKYNVPDYNYPKLVQFSAQFGWSWYETHLGGIDNANNMIGLLGYTAKSTFTTSGKYSHKTNAKNLDVYFEERVFYFTPAISYGNNPFVNTFVWRLHAGWLIPLGYKTGLTLSQTDANGNSNPINYSMIPINTNGLNAQLNGQPISSTPFHFNGLVLSLTVGFRFAGK